MNVSNLGFYIGKSINRNVVIYSFNLTDTKSINLFDPIDCYWIMRENNNEREELNYLEKTMCYGFDIMTDMDEIKKLHNDLFNFKSNALEEPIYIKLKALQDDPIRIQMIDGKYSCIINIPKTDETTQNVVIRKVFCHVSGPLNNFVDSIDITYEDPESKKLKIYSRKENRGMD